MPPIKRSTTARDRHRKVIARGKPPCWICEQPIDYDLPHLHPGAFVIDHVVPLTRGGADALHNLRAAHRHPSLQREQVRPAARRGPQTAPTKDAAGDKHLARLVVTPGGGDSRVERARIRVLGVVSPRPFFPRPPSPH